MNRRNYKRAMDLDLVRWMREGDPTALGELLQRYTGWIRWACLIWLGSSTRAELEDVVSEVYQRVVANYSSFRGESEAELRAWLKVIALRTARRSSDRSVKLAVPVDPGDLTGDDQLTDERDLGQLVTDRVRLRSCLEDLRAHFPNQHRAIVAQAQFDLSMELLAELLSSDDRLVTVSGVKAWLNRARRHLRDCLQSGCEPSVAGG